MKKYECVQELIKDIEAKMASLKEMLKSIEIIENERDDSDGHV